MLNTPPLPPEQPAPGSTAMPTQPTSAPPPPLPGAPGTDPAERVPIATLFSASEAILRQPRRVWFQLTQDGQVRLTLVLLGIAIAGALAYGLVVGTFSGGDQLWAAPVKIAGALLLWALRTLGVTNIQASWVTMGMKVGQMALHYGCNDFGSLMLEENVVSAANTTHRTTIDEIEGLIRQAGFMPRRRKQNYQLIEAAA